MSALDAFPPETSALTAARQLGERASAVGFDWPDSDGPTLKIMEELKELEDARQSRDAGHIAEELGDLLFTVVNLARHLELDAEQTLADANRKFERRFRRMEQKLRADGLWFDDLTPEAMEACWQSVKANPDSCD